MHEPIRVVVRANSQLTGIGLSTYLESQPGINMEPGIDIAEADVLVLGAVGIDGELAATLRRLTRHAPVRIVIVTSELTDAEVLAAADVRIVEMVPYSTRAISWWRRSAAAAWPGPAYGTDAGPPACAARAVFGRRAQAHRAPGTRVSAPAGRRRLETAQIAQRLCYSGCTVTNVLCTVRRRLRLNNRSHTVAYALRAGLI